MRQPTTRRPRKPKGSAGANPARGEHVLTLAGRAYRLRPSFDAIVKVEDALERSLLELFRAANAMALGYEELGTVFAELIRAGAEEADKLTRHVDGGQIARLIFEEGTTNVFPVLITVLADAISGGRQTSGEAKAPAAGPTPTT